MALPGSHDFARDAWFRGIGGVGRAIGPLTMVEPAPGGGLDAVRASLDRHIRAALPGSSGTIATALATGDQGSISKEDAEAMRRSGLAHLLSVSGLHIAAVVGAAMFLSLRLLALSERLALRFNLVLVSAGFGALAGIAYTLLTGAQVPTVRSCIAALLVLGRDRARPRRDQPAPGRGRGAGRAVVPARSDRRRQLPAELRRGDGDRRATLAAIGPCAVPAARRGIGRAIWYAALGAMVLTGLVVEVALIPLALYHFHRAGLYGVAANIVAIPLTTFVIMPLEAGALLLDSIGLGAPLWSATGFAIDLLLGMAHAVANASGAVAMLPAMPRSAFATDGRWRAVAVPVDHASARFSGLIPAAIGALWAAATPLPDLLVTGDGRHLALVGADGTPALLRDRTGEFVSDLIGEAAAYDGEPAFLADERFRALQPRCLHRPGRARRAQLAHPRHPLLDLHGLAQIHRRLRRRRHRHRRPQAAGAMRAPLAEARSPSAGQDRRARDPPRRAAAVSTASPPGLASIRGQRRRLVSHLGAACQTASSLPAGIDEVESAAAGEGEDRPGDCPARRFTTASNACFEIVDPDHRQRRR